MSEPEREELDGDRGGGGAGGDGPLVRIGELSRRTGVPADTLRAWERRYRLLSPARSDGGFRLYSAADERRVRATRALIESGLSASEAAREARSGATGPDGGRVGAASAGAVRDGDVPPTVLPAGLDRRLLDALQRFDEADANAALDEAIAALSLEALASRVVLPVLEEVGERWERGEASVGQEHFATHVVRGRLAGLARNWGAGSGPLAILACPPGELHDIGLVVFGLLLRARGWRIAYLGADTPIDTLEDAVERLDPRVVVLAALTEQPLGSAAGAIADLVRRTRVLVAGAGADESIARRVGAELLVGDPVSAAEQVARGGEAGR